MTTLGDVADTGQGPSDEEIRDIESEIGEVLGYDIEINHIGESAHHDGFSYGFTVLGGDKFSESDVKILDNALSDVNISPASGDHQIRVESA